MKISDAHKKQLKQIYYRIDEVHFSEDGLQEIDQLLNEAMNIAQSYGTGEMENSLLHDLTQTRHQQFEEALFHQKDYHRFGPAMRSLQQNFKWDISLYIR